MLKRMMEIYHLGLFRISDDFIETCFQKIQITVQSVYDLKQMSNYSHSPAWLPLGKLRNSSK